jgi:phosphohistidine phosphatase
MDIYFLRHGIAMQHGVETFPNDDRPLTDVGIQKMKKGARGIAKIVDRVGLILSSPLIRAFDTAQIAAKSLDYQGNIERCDELLPGADFRDFARLLERHDGHDALLVVGHEPNMSRVITTLLGAARTSVDFKKGALCCVKLDGAVGSGKGVLLHFLTPKQLRLIAK